MKQITYQNLIKALNDGKFELTTDIFGTSTKYAEVRKRNGNTETYEVTQYPF